jgi:benzil reductase ((S)-benzoin forming)
MKLFIITGTSSGIGKSLAELSLSQGDEVLGLCRSSVINNDLYTHFYINLNDVQSIENFFFPTRIEKYSGIYLINNAGTIGEVLPLFNKSSQAIQNEYNLNILAPAILCSKFISTYRSFLDIDLKIINISSGAATSNIDGWSTYNSSKAALNQLSLTIQEELNLRGLPIRCYSIAPGVVDTPMQEKIRESNIESFSKINDFKALFLNGDLVDCSVCSLYLMKILLGEYVPNEVVFSLKTLYGRLS